MTKFDMLIIFEKKSFPLFTRIDCVSSIKKNFLWRRLSRLRRHDVVTNFAQEASKVSFLPFSSSLSSIETYFRISYTFRRVKSCASVVISRRRRRRLFGPFLRPPTAKKILLLSQEYNKTDEERGEEGEKLDFSPCVIYQCLVVSSASSCILRVCVCVCLFDPIFN